MNIKLKCMDKLFLFYIIILFLFLSSTIQNNFLFSDEGTHLLLSVFYNDLISYLVKTGNISFNEMYRFGIGYLVNYPKLQIAYPPIFHLTTGLAFSIFGLSEIYGRYIALIYAVSSFCVMYILVKRYFGEKIAFISTVLFSFSPYALFYSSRVMQDFAVYFWLFLSVYMFSLAMEKRRYRYFAIAGILSALAFLSKQMGGFVVIFFSLILFISKMDKGEKLKYITIILSFFFMFLLPYLVILYKVGGFEINKMVAIGYAIKAGQPLSPLEPYLWLYYLFQMKSPVFWLFMLGFLFYIYKKKPRWRFILLWFIVFYICLSIIPHKIFRFYNFFFLPTYITAGYLLISIEKKIRYMSCILLFLYFVFSFLIFLPTIKYFPTEMVIDYIYKNIPNGGNVALLSDDDPLFSSVVMWHLRKMDENRTISVYRPCLFFNKTRSEIIDIIENNNIYFIIYLKDSERKEIENIMNKLNLEFELEYDKWTAQVFRYRDFTLKEKPLCNYICLTKQKICK